MKMSAIAEFLGSKLIGKDIEIKGVCSLNKPKQSHLAFYNFDGPLCTYFLMGVLVKPNVLCDCISYIPVENPRLAHARVMRKFFIPDSYSLIPQGDGWLKTSRFDQVHIYDCAVWGNNCFFKPGAVIGGSGFGWENDENGVPIRRPHIGGVVIGNNVEIGANSTVDRGTFDDTVIADNVKIDNLVHVAHNCDIGKNTCIVAGSVICGSVTIGENCWIGANATIMNQVTIGNNVTVGIGANVVKDVPDNSVIAGMKAQPIESMKQISGFIERL